MVELFVFTASRLEALRDYKKTIENPIPDSLIIKFLGEHFYRRLRKEYPEGPIYAWGATPKKNNIRIWEKMSVGDYVIAYQLGYLKKLFRIIGKAHHVEFAKHLWGVGKCRDNYGLTWEYMYFLQHVANLNIESPIPFRGHTHLTSAREKVEKAIVKALGKPLDQIDKELKSKIMEKKLEKLLKVKKIRKPKAVLKHTSHIIEKIRNKDFYVPDTWSRRKVRIGQAILREILLRMYGGKCCICGLNIPELLEVAHIKSWTEDPHNRLNPENCLLLCPLHHKALDKGYIKIVEGKIRCTDKVTQYVSDVTREYLIKYDGAELYKPVMSYMEALRALEKYIGGI